MNIIIAVISQKGGTAKTTTAGVLAAGLAEAGNRVLCIDANEQGDLSDTFAAEPGGGTLELLTGTDAARLIRKTNQPGVYIITGDERLATAERLIKTEGPERGLILKASLRPIKRDFDYCIIDAPGSFNTLMLNALGAADRVIIPVQPDFYSLKSINRLIKNVRYVKENINPTLRTDGILLTRYQGRRNISKETAEILQDAQEALGTRLFNTRIRENARITEAPGHRKTILQYAPTSNGAIDYRAFIAEYQAILKGAKRK